MNGIHDGAMQMFQSLFNQNKNNNLPFVTYTHTHVAIYNTNVANEQYSYLNTEQFSMD